MLLTKAVPTSNQMASHSLLITVFVLVRL
jgi:hypothetical protein